MTQELRGGRLFPDAMTLRPVAVPAGGVPSSLSQGAAAICCRPEVCKHSHSSGKQALSDLVRADLLTSVSAGRTLLAGCLF